jgi:hypothetical protein
LNEAKQEDAGEANRVLVKGQNPVLPPSLDVQGLAVGGSPPVFLTSFSKVIVVVPPGVEIFVSCLVDDLACSLHPVMPIETKLAIRVAAIMRFIFNTFRW